MAEKPIKATEIDYRKGNTPEWVRRAIEESFCMEAEDARKSGNLGYMTRALVLATMPYKDPKADVFTRSNGDFKLRILAGYEGGIPFGIYPRLLMSWVATEAVRSQSPVVELGDSMRSFLTEVLELRTNSGGSRGASTRVAEQMKRLFGSLITAQFTGKSAENKGGFVLRNIVIADGLTLEDEHSFDLDSPVSEGENALWTPQQAADAGQWKSKVRLSDPFFRELLDHPVPIDLRAYKALRGSPLAMDIYSWLTHRMSYTNRATRPIPWESLMMQFGSSYSTSDIGQATRDFKKAFLNALKAVLIVYPTARLDVRDNGLVLLPSPPHILPLAGKGGGQASLF